MANEPYKPQLKLVVQANIPIGGIHEAAAEYDNLKIFLLAISPDITLDGQIIKQLEPCCKKKPKGESHDQNP